MIRKQIILPIVVAALPAATMAQHHTDPSANVLQQEETARRVGESHYLAPRTSDDTPDAPISLIRDYQLALPGTAQRIADWTASHPVNAMSERMNLLYANLLVKEGKWDEALDIYRHHNLINVAGDEREDAMLHQAIACIHTGDVAHAEALLAELNSSKRFGIDVQYYSGYVQYMKGNYAAAMPYLETAAASADYRRKAVVYLADCHLQNHQPQVAQRLLREAAGQIAPELTPEVMRIDGEAMYEQGLYGEAITRLKQYVAATEESPKRTALYKLGMSQLQTGDYNGTAELLSQSAGSERDALSQSAWLHAGIAYIATQRKQQAGIAFQQASEMHYDSKTQEEALYNYAMTLHDGATMGFGESVGVFERFLNAFPQSQYSNTVSQHLTEVYFTTKNYPAALASINKIKNPTPAITQAKQQVLYNLGVQKFIDGDFTAARNYMQQSIQAKDNVEAYYWKGESEYRLGQYSQAAADLSRYINNASAQDAKNKALAHYALGYTLFKQQKYAEALPHFQHSATSATNSALLRADAYNRLGDCQFTARQYDAAFNSYATSLSTDRSHGDYALLQQAFISGLKGNYQQKVNLLDQLGRDYGDSEYGADALYEQGRAYVQSGNRQKAVDAFNRLITNYPQSVNARRASNEIGLIYKESGQTDIAIKAFTQVIEKYPNTVEAQTALASMRDIYTAQGKVNEYAQLAAKAGKALTAAELDNMTLEAAEHAMAAGQRDKSLQFYRQLEAQTQSANMRHKALDGQLRAAKEAKNNDAVIDVATRMLADPKTSPDAAAEARLYRAQSYMAKKNSDAAVGDYQQLAADTRTVFGAQGTVELAQYAFDTRQYQSAETILTNFTNSGTTHTYWLARAFVLLADVYAATDRDIEARQYLLSLKSNYTESAEINNMIEERLKKLKN